MENTTKLSRQSRRVVLDDSTMREGEQAPGVSFSPAEKVTLARELQSLGIPMCEVGIPAMGGIEGEAVEAVVRENLDIRLVGWNRGRREDLDESFALGLTSVHIGLPASDHHLKRRLGKSRAWVIETMQELVEYATSTGGWVSVSAEDAGRADLEFLVAYARAVEEAGAARMRVSDTVGILDPFGTYELFDTLVAEVPGLAFEAHMHNDFGFATANTFAAVRAGAQHAQGTVNGLGD